MSALTNGDAWEIAEHQINITGNKGPQEVHVAGKPIQLRKHELGPYGLGM